MEALNISLSDIDITKYKVPDLKRELKLRNLSTAGNKTELLERLQDALNSKLDDTATVEDSIVEELDEDLLNDDEDVGIDDTEAVINDLDSPTESASKPTTKRKSSESKTDSEPKETKKIVLNRNTSEITTEHVENLSTKHEDNEEKVDNEKKVVKLSLLSPKERLEMRAKKFGEPLSGDAKKVVRAERFSGTNSSSTTKTTITPANASPLDVLKKRAERFGVATSTVLQKLESLEKMNKRKERFLNSSSANGVAK